MDRYDWQEANRATVLEGTEALLRTAESLERSRRIAQESEDIGTSIIADLGTQRESLERVRDSLQNTDQFLTQSQKILNSMYKRVFTNKFILILIILTEVVILGAVVYLKFFKKH